MKQLLFSILLASNLSGAVYHFNSSGNFLTVPNYASLQSITNKITVCAWLTKNTITPANEPVCFLSKGGDFSAAEQWSLGSNTNQLDFYYYPVGSATAAEHRTGANTITMFNTFMFLAFTFDFANSNSLTWYLNGTPVTTGGWISGSPTNGPIGNTIAVDVGSGRINTTPCGGGRRWLGFYSEVAIWNEVLTLAQLELIRKSQMRGTPLQVVPNNLKAYFVFDSAPDGVELIPSGSIGAHRVPDRKTFGPSGSQCPGGAGTRPVGAAERVCSYPPNE